MLINSLSLENFKCFEKLDVTFAPITLLTGANSSGKSSLINAILAVLQTEQFPFYLSPNGKYVNMGSFEEIIFQGDDSLELKLYMNFKSLFYRNITGAGSILTSWKINVDNSLPTLKNVYFNNDDYQYHIYEKDNKYYMDLIASDLSLYVRNEEDVLSSFSEILNFNSAKVNIDLSPKEKDAVVSYNKVSIKFENAEVISIDDIFKVKSRSYKDNYLNIITGLATSLIEHVKDGFNYVGSFRQPPERTYYQKAKSEKINPSGEGYIDQIIEWEETDPEKFSTLNNYTFQMQLLEEIKTTKLKGGRFEFGIRSHKNGKVVPVTDVGFGISQFLPIIVADLQLPDSSCLAVSQPEIHLHPKIQAAFGNYLVNQINRTKKQYIIETHSEYLLNRIRLLLVTGELKPEDVKVYYFENDGIKSVVHEIEFATNGAVKGAPDGFFETYEMDVMDIAMHAVK
ncbi:DUF3696 domain-containing protein [Larkinella sp. VNQ87]|uniref:DUF3696 domain-containing protein n=1 Tax=Larkinella sp. VNQ87 TaxID=3400921 RepID=UPI003C11F82A